MKVRVPTVFTVSDLKSTNTTKAVNDRLKFIAIRTAIEEMTLSLKESIKKGF
jgi:hypothetical protein